MAVMAAGGRRGAGPIGDSVSISDRVRGGLGDRRLDLRYRILGGWGWCREKMAGQVASGDQPECVGGDASVSAGRERRSHPRATAR